MHELAGVVGIGGCYRAQQQSPAACLAACMPLRPPTPVLYHAHLHPANHELTLSRVQEPPAAATDPEFDAIVVSEETVSGAHAINRVRQERGYAPLAVVVVGLIYCRRRAGKLSSTDLRAEDAVAGAAGGSGGGRGSAGGSPRTRSPSR